MAASGNDRVGGVASGRMLYELTQHQGVNMARNMQVLLANRPTGWVEESNFKIVEADVPKPGPGEVLVKNLWLSLDPYMRGRMNAAKSYAKYVEIGEVMTGGTVGQGRGRWRGWSAGEIAGLPRGRHRRRPEEVRVRGQGARVRRLRGLQGRQ